MTKSANDKILEVENLLQSLTDEMLKLKSATRNYEETKENLQNMCESIDKISATHQKLTGNMSEFLAEIKKMNYREQTDKILQQNESQSKALSDLVTEQTDRILENNENRFEALSDEFEKQTERILQNSESQSKAFDELTKQSERILQHDESQSKTLRLVKYLTVLGMLLGGAATIGVFMLWLTRAL